MSVGSGLALLSRSLEQETFGFARKLRNAKHINLLSVISHGLHDGQGDRVGIRISLWHVATSGRVWMEGYKHNLAVAD